MALARRFNPPPNWPPAPPDWTPPPTWQPDPAWGPPPPGWRLWTTYRANPGAFGFSFAVAGGCYALLLVVVLIGTGGRLNPETAGAVIVPFVLAGLITGLIAWNRPVRWGVWLYPLVVVGIALGFSVIANLGRMS